MTLSYFFFFLIYGLALPYLTPALLDLGYSKSQIGLITGGTYVVATFGPMIGGRISDTWLSIDQTIRACAVGVAISSALLWLFNDGSPSWLIVAGLIAWSAFRSPVVSQQDALAMQVANDNPKSYTRMRLAGSIGFALGSMFLGYLADSHGMGIFWPVFAISCSVFLFHSFFLPKDQGHEAKEHKTGFWRNLDSHWWIWLTAMVLHWLAFSPYHYGFSLLLKEQGVPEAKMGIYWTLSIVAEVAVFFFSGSFFKRWNYRTLLFVALGANLVRWIIIGLFPSPVIIGLTQLLHGLGFALFYAAAMQAIAVFSGGKNRASYQGLFSTAVAGVGSVLGSVVSGYMHEMMPFHRLLLWCAPIQLLAMLVLAFNPLKKTE